MKKYKTILLSIFVSVSVFASTALEIEQTRSLETNTTSKTTKTYDASTNSNKVSEWNTSDWNDMNSKNGADTGSIGRMQSFFGNGKSNINQVSNQAVEDDNSIDKNMKIWTQTKIDELSSATTDRDDGVNVNQLVKCYITRDIPIRYRCTKTNLTYGGFIQSNGQQAKKKCENECYDQNMCLQAEEPKKVIETIKSIKVDRDTTIAESYVMTSNDIPLKEITFDVNSSTNYASRVKIYVKNGEEEQLVANIPLKTGKQTIPMGYTATKVSVLLELVKDLEKVSVENIIVSHKEKGKFICPELQDISDRDAGSFAYVCPSGNITTYSINGSTYKVCGDYGVTGDNKDGSFSDMDRCSFICKTHYDCISDTTTINPSVLEQFREGCIEGQDNCELETCPDLRKSGSKIISEVVFDATNKPTVTVASGVQKDDVYRPRPILSTDIDFKERNAEEYKEEAFINMLKSGTFASSISTIDEDTESDSAFSLSINGENNNISGTSLNWILKPSANSVNSDKYSFYVIVEVLTERLDYILDAEKHNVKNRILYVKTGAGDNLKPFALKKDAEYNIFTSDNKLVSTKNESASWEFQTFLTSWFPIPSSDILEPFQTKKIEVENEYLRIPIIENTSDIYLDSCKGVVRSVVVDGPVETNVYTGNFNGTGESIINFKVYAFVKPANEIITYKESVKKIENKELSPIFDSLLRANYKKSVADDGSLNLSNDTARDYKIKIFLYGKETNKQSFTQIIPKKEDVGKQGYLFVFTY